MAYLVKTKDRKQIEELTPAKLRNEYLALAEEYNKLLGGSYIYCPHCGNWIVKTGFYLNSRSADGIEHLACKKCLRDMATDIGKDKDTRVDNRTKAMAVLRRLNRPFHEEVYQDCVKAAKEGTQQSGERACGWGSYMTTILGLPQFKGETYDNSNLIDYTKEVETIKREPRKEIIKKFGTGFSNDDYLYLQDEYDSLCARTQVDTWSQEKYAIQICYALLNIRNGALAGKDTTKERASLDSLMASANLQPRQNVNNAATDSLSFGQLIEKWETEKPIPDPDPEFQDVNKIGKLIRVFFKGHLARALGLDNGYSQEYDDFIKQYTVEKQNNSEDGDESSTYNKIFGING